MSKLSFLKPEASYSLLIWVCPPWLGSPTRVRTTTAAPSPPSPMQSRSLRTCSFSSSSFKDIHTLSQPEPESPKSPSVFRPVRISTSKVLAWGSRSLSSSPSVTLPPCFDHGAVVIYYTSLRVVRRTFDDCRTVRSILRGFSVAIDERDVSMDDRFRKELDEILGPRNVTLPRVFVGGICIGGADDVRELYERGELQGLIERLPSSKADV